jgi:hypothetical protein
MLVAKVFCAIIALSGILILITATTSSTVSEIETIKSKKCSQYASSYLECIGPEHWAAPSSEQMTKAN